MSSPAVEVPEDVRLKAQAQGSEGRRWLGRLGRLIGELERDWGISVGSALSGGSESYVAHATMDSGAHAVVKIEMPPYPSFATEVRTLLAADVHGYVRLLEHHEGRHATLQQRLGPSLRTFALPITTQIEILCSTLQCAWNTPTPEGLPTGADKARWLSDFIAATWKELNRPCSRRVIEQALAFAESRKAAFDLEAAVLVHGDAHSANALQDPRYAPSPTRFKLVDPDGLLAEPAYDLAIPLEGVEHRAP